ncbi:MAG: PmoA family protein [Candidatus Hydrogenedentes bacterium]|nr:PmoA family protein [Candidatus Hydrogenedentota bacterium]
MGTRTTLFIVLLSLYAGVGLAAPALPKAKAGPQSVSVSVGGKPVLDYRFNNVPFKPYVEKLGTPAGINILRDAPSDHLHHHALMFALGVNGVSYWAETPKDGKQVHREFLPGAKPETVVAERLDWVDPAGKTVLNETREITLPAAPDNVTLLTWQSTLSVPEGAGPTKLTGDHYYGLGMRFLVSMDKGGVFQNAAGVEGELVRGDERLSRAPWAAYTADADGKPVTVAMFDDPKNVRYPAWWFTMQTAFAYLSATMNLHREPLEMAPGKPLPLRYGIALWDGRQDKETIEKTYQYWLQLINK